MNFLSHFYFDRDTQNPNVILGTVLPDLLKNANKNWNPHPQKHKELFEDNEVHKAILKGWERHLQVDLFFHSSLFFNDKMKELKIHLLPILGSSTVRPSFLSHIGVELLLDHLLVENRKIKIDDFYAALDMVRHSDISSFLKNCGIDDVDHFLRFYTSFKSSKYLLSYQKLDNISYALQRICMRLWEHPFSEKTVNELTGTLDFYKAELEADFMAIFEDIENRLS